jgi:methionine-rich copper-binding protein CopC
MIGGRRQAGSRRRRHRTSPALEQLQSRLVLYSASGNAWPNPQLITISFMPDGTNVGGGETSNLFSSFNNNPSLAGKWQDIILEAAQTWAQETNINFAVVPDDGSPEGSGPDEQGDPAFGDIRIGGYHFGSSTLALTYQPPPTNNFSVAGDMTFNTGQAFNAGSTYDLFTVAMHEFGHALGLNESSDSSAVEYGTYTGIKTGLAADDIAGIRSIYSAGGPRTPDVYNTDGASNGTLDTAASIDASINSSTMTVLVPNIDISTAGQSEYFAFTAPAGAGSTLELDVQSSGLSLLAPEVTVYGSDGRTALTSSDGEGQYGTVLTVSVSGVAAGEQFYVKVQGADATQMGTGSYALGLSFNGTTPPLETSPCVAVPNGNPEHAGGGNAPIPFGLGPYTGAAAVISSITAADGSGANGTVVDSSTVSVIGTAPASDTITVYCDGYLMGQTVALADNTWIFDNSSTPLGDGTYLFTAIATDPGGYSTTLSIPYAVTINTAATDPPAGGNGPGSTIDLAEDLGALDPPVGLFGSIGDGPAGAAGVNWYQFALTAASRVELTVSTPAGDPSFAGVISLYNNDPGDTGDPYDVGGHRLIGQVEASPSSGVVAYSQDLGPGDYFVAVSGAGNLDFSPVIAGSGFDGATGNYELTASATDLGLSASGPTLLSSDPVAGAELDSSPLAIRLDLSGPLNPTTIVAGQTVALFYAPGALGGVLGTPVALAGVNFSPSADELQLFPLAPLAPGHYTVRLAGDSSTDESVLAGPGWAALGADAAHPAGVNEFLSFQVDGVDGIAGATSSDDTPATAQQLGDVTGAGVIEVNGAIGVDPSFNPGLSPDPADPEPQFDPANQVDLYHFEITAPGRYAILAEVFAGRIGSPLEPGISLYELDPGTGQLGFLAGDKNTLNPTVGTDGSVPLFNDSALTAGLTAGDYYLAVADGTNTPAPVEGQMPGSPGLYDPNQPGSARDGSSTGPYILNVLVQAMPDPPRVIASSPSSGQVLDASPTQVTVQFSEPINIQELAFQPLEASAQGSISQVFVESTDGTQYPLSFVSYNRATNQVTFQMLDGLANGSYSIHLSGWAGLTDLAGSPIVGDDLSGDYVIPFQVQAPPGGISGNMTDGYTFSSQTGDGATQNLGVLFPDDLQAGVTIGRSADSGSSPASPSTGENYVIQLLQNQTYSFGLSGDDLPAGAQVTLTSATGQSIPLLPSSDGQDYFAPLAAGTYTVTVGGWSNGESAGISYRLTINLVGQQDNAPPLVDGPAPLLQIQLAGTGSSTGSPPTGDSGAGPTTVSLPAPSVPNSVVNADTGGLASLGASPLGGAVDAAGMTSGSPIQMTLEVPSAPGAGGLVSLITMMQVPSWGRRGDPIEASDSVDQPVADVADGPDSGSPVQVLVVPDSGFSVGNRTAAFQQGRDFGVPASIAPALRLDLMANDLILVGPDVESPSVGASIPASGIPADGAAAPSLDALGPVETGTPAPAILTGMVMIGGARGCPVCRAKARPRVHLVEAGSRGPPALGGRGLPANPACRCGKASPRRFHC